jgi:hypothetical protein
MGQKRRLRDLALASTACRILEESSSPGAREDREHQYWSELMVSPALIDPSDIHV